jgi:hypothetical protein
MSQGAIYLYIGLEYECRIEHKGEWPRSAEGHLGITSVCSDLGQVVDQFFDEDQSEFWPGVFHYEVVEGLGCWLWENFDCDVEAFYAKLTEATDQWRAEGQRQFNRASELMTRTLP